MSFVLNVIVKLYYRPDANTKFKTEFPEVFFLTTLTTTSGPITVLTIIIMEEGTRLPQTRVCELLYPTIMTVVRVYATDKGKLRK